MGNSASITATNLSKRFGKEALFNGLSLSAKPGESLAIMGKNGAGKSTLLLILLGFIEPDKGSILTTIDSRPVTGQALLTMTGYMSPSMEQYTMLSGKENAFYAAREKNPDAIDDLFHTFDLYRHRNKPVSIYSTGMKQRLKFICAIINNPSFLILDEPGANLDIRGRELLYAAIEKMASSTALIMATNDSREAELCQRILTLE